MGIIIGSLFHGLISLDLDQHFYDFTAVLFFLFATFLPPSAQDTEGAEPARMTLWLRWIAAAAAFALVVLSVLPPSELTVQILSDLPFVLWVPFLTWWISFALRNREPAVVEWRLAPAASFVVAVAFLNGLTPYTELKTAYSFNMYSNLLTAQGETNDYLIPKTVQLRDGYDGPVQIVQSSDPGLEVYREHDYLIAYPQFQQYLVDRSLSVTYIRNGVTTNLPDTQAVEGLATSGPLVVALHAPRAIDRQSPPRCQDVFLPAL